MIGCASSFVLIKGPRAFFKAGCNIWSSDMFLLKVAVEIYWSKTDYHPLRKLFIRSNTLHMIYFMKTKRVFLKYINVDRHTTKEKANLQKSVRIITVHYWKLRIWELSYLLLSWARIDGSPTNEYIKLNNGDNLSWLKIDSRRIYVLLLQQRSMKIFFCVQGLSLVTKHRLQISIHILLLLLL